MESTGSFRDKVGHIIFEADTPAARLFDVVLLWMILLSVLLVLLESVPEIRAVYGPSILTLEWVFTGLFTLEYLLRIYSARKRWRYVTSFYGMVDLLAIIPGYLSLFYIGPQYLLVVRALRLLRVFRILKLTRFLGEAEVLARAMQASLPKITVFIFTVLTVVLISGSLLYVIEGPEHGFTSIPIAMYWAIVTLTTVGYGDIVPGTAAGKFLANTIMILGYGIIAVPTGIVTVELSQATRQQSRVEACANCGQRGHDGDAVYCKYCGSSLQGPSLSEG
jgi:voltage-gated potassium channel